MLQLILILEFAGVEEYIEIYTRIAKCMESYGRWYVDLVIHTFHRCFCDLQRDTLDFIEIRIVADADGDFYSDIASWHVEVSQYGGRYLLVWYDYCISEDGYECRESPCDVGDLAFFASR